jgi:hypothetical protein
MKIFGFEIGRAKKADSRKGQLERDAQGQGPFTPLFQNWIARKVMPALYEALRESIPVIDGAIAKYITLDGMVQVDGNNAGLVNEIDDWMGDVRVNDMQTGLQAFNNNRSNETYEQGFSICEMVPNKERTDIVRLNVADSKDIKFMRGNTGLVILYRGRSKENKPIN